MSLRVVLLAEGVGESHRVLKAPGAPILSEEFGPAHHLFSRALSAARRLPSAAILFEEPLRLPGRTAKGSDLLVRSSLRQLLTWPDPQAVQAPHVAIVLVDADREDDREARLTSHVGGLPASAQVVVVCVAVREFEAWLIADVDALRNALERRVDEVPSPESLRPGEAKRSLRKACDDARKNARDVRLSIAQLADLAVVAKRCPAFARVSAALAR